MKRNLLIALCLALFSMGSARGQEFQKILFLGNSITLHGPKPDIGWTNNWGMAASSADKDCVHRITQGLKKKDGTLPQTLIKNIAGFERQYTTFDTSALVKEARQFNPDLIVVGIGENVRWLGTDLSKHIKDAAKFNSNQPGGAVDASAKALTADEAKVQFKNSLARLLNDIRADRSPKIVVRSCFFTDAAKDEALRQACVEVGGIFVPLGGLNKDESNLARSERPYKHAGVGGHPGDKGMRAIADAVLGALRSSSPTNTPRMKIGAYYFAGWAGKSPFDDGTPEHAWAKGMPTHFTKKLATDFAGRTPVWGWRDDTPELMERQIDLAADNGVAYFSFCWYWHDNKTPINVQAIDEDPKHLPMQLFMKAKNNHRMEFSLLVANHRGAEIVGTEAWRQAADHWITIFKHPRYLRSNGKPVLVIFSPRGADKDGLAYLQEAARKAGFPGVEVAACGADKLPDGFQIRTAYNVKPRDPSGQRKSERHSYQELVEANVQAWQAVPGQAYIPVATQGWDRRPWEASNGEGLGPNGSPVSWYFDKGTPQQFGEMLARMAAWMEANPTAVTKDRLAIIYAWNEIGEGGWLVPCRDDPDGVYLKAIKHAVYGP
jgi:lysophospholipase L1-like esterase